MKFTRLSDSAFECVLTREDCEDYSISMTDFVGGDTAKVKDFINDIIEQAEDEIDVHITGGEAMAMQMRAIGDELVIRISSESDFKSFLDEFKHLAETNPGAIIGTGIAEPGQGNIPADADQTLDAALPFGMRMAKEATKKPAVAPDTAPGRNKKEQIIAAFATMEDVENFCANINKTWGIQNALYKGDDGVFYLALKRLRLKPEKFAAFLEILSEFASLDLDGDKHLAYLNEHARVLLSANALNKIKEYA